MAGSVKSTASKKEFVHCVDSVIALCVGDRCLVAVGSCGRLLRHQARAATGPADGVTVDCIRYSSIEAEKWPERRDRA